MCEGLHSLPPLSALTSVPLCTYFHPYLHVLPSLCVKDVVEEDLGDDKMIARGIAESTLHPDNPYHPNNYRAAPNYPMIYRYLVGF